jgi:hypothetical protein
VWRASAASSSCALHSCFFFTLAASPSAELTGDRGPVLSPEKVFLINYDTPGQFESCFVCHLLAFQIWGLWCSYFFLFLWFFSYS